MSSNAPASQRKSVPFSRVALGFAALFTLGVLVAIALHRAFVAAERVVARHVSADAAAVLRVDLEKATLFAPVRRALLPLLVARDTREALALWGPGDDDWALALGGNFPEGALSGIGDALREEGTPWRGEGQRLVAPSGHALAQASDRALLLASSPERLDKVLPASDEHLRLGIPLRGALAFAGDPRKLPWLGRGLAPLGDVARVTASADWSNPLVVHVTLTYASAPPAGAAALVRERFEALVGAEEAARLGHLVGPPEVERQGAALVVTTRWDHQALERLAERLAAALREGPSARRE